MVLPERSIMLKALVTCLSVLFGSYASVLVYLRNGSYRNANPDVWTDGSLVEDKVSGASSSGSFFKKKKMSYWSSLGPS